MSDILREELEWLYSKGAADADIGVYRPPAKNDVEDNKAYNSGFNQRRKEIRKELWDIQTFDSY